MTRRPDQAGSEAAVFVSYARRAGRDAAVALHDTLTDAGVSVFLDTAAIEDGTHFPRR